MARSDQLRTMLPTYQALLAKKALRILVFSGLYDGMEPHLGTELWLSKLNLTLKAPTRPWFDPLVRALDQGAGAWPLSKIRTLVHAVPSLSTAVRRVATFIAASGHVGRCGEWHSVDVHFRGIVRCGQLAFGAQGCIRLASSSYASSLSYKLIELQCQPQNFRV